MGLDMYLTAERSLFGPLDKPDTRAEDIIAMFPELTSEVLDMRTVNLSFYVGYWRKANHIHAWFVKNVQDGVDKCLEYYVDKIRLIELKEVCERVIKEPDQAPTLLPTTSGFFFGNPEYDAGYFEDVRNTITQIDRVLPLIDQGYDINYHSSW